MAETVTTGRAKRSTAGNRMRELLEKAHQDDELFAEEDDDAEFEAPQDQKDVFLEEFAETDDEVEDDDDEEAKLRREERKQAKPKGRALFNPLVKAPRIADWSTLRPKESDLALLDPKLDIDKMAPSTLILEIRKQRREQKRQQRSETRRSNLRASTLKSEVDLIEKERAEKVALASSRKGRKAQHETGEVRGARPMTQDELIAAALEEEERNKEALTDWLRKEEERRELRRVGRKRVRGPRWTWISRTVGKLVEVVDAASSEGPKAGTSGPDAAGELPEAGPSGTSGKREVKLEHSTDAADESSTLTGDARADASAAASTREPQRDASATHPPAPATPAADPASSTAPSPSAAGPTDTGAAEAASVTTPGATSLAPAAHVNKDVSCAGATATPGAAGDAAQAASGTATTNTDQCAVVATATEKEKPEAAAATSEPGPSTPSATTAAASTTADAPAETAAEPKPADAKDDSAAAVPAFPTTSTEDSTNDKAPALAGTKEAKGTTPGVPTPAPTATPAGDRSTPGPTMDPASAPAPATTPEAPTGPYTRNYLILSQVLGGLPAELSLILGSHVDWGTVRVIPARNRPINRRPPADPLTGQPARYRHPAAGVPYANAQGYATIEAVLAGRYVWSEGGWWAGGEADAAAEGIEEIPGWREATARGWLGGREWREEAAERCVDGDDNTAEGHRVAPEAETMEVDNEPEVRPKGRARAGGGAARSSRGTKRKAAPVEADVEPSETEPKAPMARSKGKSKKRRR